MDQVESKRLNDLFPRNYFFRTKIEKVKPLCFEHNGYYRVGDMFYVIETGGVFRVLFHGKFSGYICEHISGPKELNSGYTTTYIRNTPAAGYIDQNPVFTTLRVLLGTRDYYHVADILYDLSNEVEEIPDGLFNFIIETCDEANFVKSWFEK